MRDELSAISSTAARSQRHVVVVEAVKTGDQVGETRRHRLETIVGDIENGEIAKGRQTDGQTIYSIAVDSKSSKVAKIDYGVDVIDTIIAY